MIINHRKAFIMRMWSYWDHLLEGFITLIPHIKDLIGCLDYISIHHTVQLFSKPSPKQNINLLFGDAG